LTGHDIDHLWNHDQVLEGCPAKGNWDLIVECDGEYEFELRRYPVEANAPIRGAIPVPEDLKTFLIIATNMPWLITIAATFQSFLHYVKSDLFSNRNLCPLKPSHLWTIF
jgi:hypothetical protein